MKKVVSKNIEQQYPDRDERFLDLSNVEDVLEEVDEQLRPFGLEVVYICDDPILHRWFITSIKVED